MWVLQCPTSLFFNPCSNPLITRMLPIPHGKIQVLPGDDGHQGDVVNPGAMIICRPHEFPIITTRDLPIHLRKLETRGPMTKGAKARREKGGMEWVPFTDINSSPIGLRRRSAKGCLAQRFTQSGGGKLTFRQGLTPKSWQAKEPHHVILPLVTPCPPLLGPPRLTNIEG